MTHRLPFASGILLSLVACSAPGPSQHPAQATGLSPAACVAALAAGAQPDAARCPAFLLRAVAEARAMCTEAGGKLEGAQQADVWKLDVDDDGHDEVAFEMNGNVTCVDAYSLFECGSLGCPKVVYADRNGTWEAIAALFAFGPESVDIMSERVGGHRTLRACLVGPPCAELWYYEWLGRQYDRTRLEVRGFKVDLANVKQTLRPLTAATDVKATPSATGASVGHYDAGTEVVFIGTAAGYAYVSPCNACESGFVPAAAVRAE